MGIRIRFRDIDDYGIYYFKEGKSKPSIVISTDGTCHTEKLFTILHELGHHIDFIRGGWSDKDFEAVSLFDDKGSKAPLWAKKRVIIREKIADDYGKEIADLLDIKLPEFLYEYDVAKTRFRLKELCKRDKISDHEWNNIKRRIRERI